MTVASRRQSLPKQADSNAPLLVVENLKTHFSLGAETVQHADDGVAAKVRRV